MSGEWLDLDELKLGDIDSIIEVKTEKNLIGGTLHAMESSATYQDMGLRTTVKRNVRLSIGDVILNAPAIRGDAQFRRVRP